MEDEECLPEHSSLNVYLQNLGFSDIQVTKKVQNPRGVKFEVSKSRAKRPQIEAVDEDVIEQIGIIISTRLLFEEDLFKIEKLLSNFAVVKTGLLKCMFKGFFGIAILFIGLCLYWVVGYYAFVFVSSFYAYNAAVYLRRKYYYRIRLKKLSAVVQGNFMLLKKSIKFIEESRLIESQFSSKSNSGEFLEGFDFYKNFQNDFLLSVNRMSNIFMKSTQKLIYKVPLYDYVENPECYMCNNFKVNQETVNLSKLFEIYLLLQSEFLQRLILSLIPNLKLSENDNFYEINEILTDTCVSLLKIKKMISTKFKFLFFNGIHSPKARVEFNLPKKNRISGNIYFEEFLFSIHEVSNNFQNLLLKCRILEESAKSDKKPEDLENELVKMQNKLNSCLRNLNDCLILLKRSKGTTDKADKVSVQGVEKVENSNEKLNKIEVGYTDLDPQLQDEIFEVFLASEKGDRNMPDDWDTVDRHQQKLEKEYSKKVINELKIRLVEKANSWKKREREILKRKGLIETTEDLLEKENKSSDEENANGLNSESRKIPLKRQNLFQTFENDSGKPDNLIEGGGKFDLGKLTCKDKVFFDSQEDLQASEKSYEDSNSETLEIDVNDPGEMVMYQSRDINFKNTQSPAESFKTDFFNDLSKAREKIFKSTLAADEEFFCDSADDSN